MMYKAIVGIKRIAIAGAITCGAMCLFLLLEGQWVVSLGWMVATAWAACTYTANNTLQKVMDIADHWRDMYQDQFKSN